MPASARPVCLVASASNFWIEKSEISYISEQTSHHPPISCFYLENQKQGYCVNGYVWTKSQFTGNSVLCGMVGECEVELPRLKEVVCFPFPVMMRSSTRPVFPTSPVPVSSLASWLFSWSMKSLSPASKLVTRLTSPSSLKYNFFFSVSRWISLWFVVSSTWWRPLSRRAMRSYTTLRAIGILATRSSMRRPRYDFRVLFDPVGVQAVPGCHQVDCLAQIDFEGAISGRIWKSPVCFSLFPRLF